MQKITLLCIGSPKRAWHTEACKQYTERLSHDVQFDIIEVAASKQKDPAKQADEESQALLDKLSKSDADVWVLDERGREYTSVEFARSLSEYRDNGRALVFVLGGAYGLTDIVRKQANQLFALSRMTLPHDLARVFFLEQLYRAQQIQKGTGYHH